MNKKLDFKLILIGLTVHSIIFYSIFDVYFKSPLVHGMNPIPKFTKKSPAKRLVLFVADGLRSDTFFNLIDENESMFLSQKKNANALFAISNTQVPTESRPGHVAMIAGFYEDISAIAKGWKENPVEFDSFFNKSKYTWAFGSPDILNLFKKSSNNVFLQMYDSSIEDFASQNATVLDTWVLHHFKKFIYHSQVNKTETKMLKEDGIVFFFHLLGIDTHGHSKKPHSVEYKSNVVYVDNLVREINQIIDEYYSGDNGTAFVFTADHGMTDWGSHGSGDDSERLTPFVAWGAGVNSNARYDRQNLLNIQQISIAPLMAHLIGVPIPINSMGKLPLEILNSNLEIKSLALKQNALQIIEQLKIKYDHCKKTAIFFKEFGDLKLDDVLNNLKSIDSYIQNENYNRAVISSKLISEHFFPYFLRSKFCIISSCVGWIMYLLNHNLKSIIPSELDKKVIKSSSINKIFLGLIVTTLLAAYYQSFPLSYYFYTLLPILLWRKSDQRIMKLIVVFSSILLGIFPLLPVIQGYAHLLLVYIGSVCSNVIFFFLMKRLETIRNSRFSKLMAGLNILSFFNIVWIRISIENNSSLPLLGQLYESLFVLFLGLQMVSWLLIESYTYSGEFNVDFALNKKRSSFFTESNEDDECESMKWSNVFRVYLLIFHLLLAFFGTGNMASINSFDPVSVYCFITVFSPFLMGFLLFLKITIPFLIVVVVFYCVYDIIHLSIKNSYVFLMIMCDLMALHFFFLIRTEGSWLDIGTSISHYIIVMIKIIIVSVLFSVAHFLFKCEITRFKVFKKIKDRLIKND
ncbi:GPI ethanolamine phosphate transferase 1 isoform X1 [Brachionus plicatilis]|uniref:GPI ethanolamine phosphate transferase 1 n=1 Tax=Brachionus plicatilis TaxID=10195 RepID=A0A3M7RCV4_BRAPC|nr:GPI ethanolamine phosphate transferase 1 isoform X1 [Brachionus plicatilis]